ncbi:hypothetical protein UFOVP42_28 [uncultured Caudovirales phage]|uniref:Uncharacterized protein n=1 Tax=uncultured Caudovirales phage TaxID=2100421 RepID=A0A6J5KQP7_9CAUD|nr:hypothetical protein UFOVP42_28 [uncultured Caudovirales phage]
MIFIIYAVLALISLVLTLFAIITAPIMVLFATDQLGWCNNHSYQAIAPRLPKWLNWFMTPDNCLWGDDTFEFLHNSEPPYIHKVKWLWRNPAYSFALRYIEGNPVYWKGDKTIKDNDGAKEGWLYVNSDGLFQFVYIKRIFSTNRCIYCNFGWNIRVLVDDNVSPKPNPVQATFVFSPRISGFR